MDKKFLVLHTSATPTDWTIERLWDYFMRDRKDRVAGYHAAIDINGKRTIWYEWVSISWGCGGAEHTGVSNANAINICTIGGWEVKDTRTKAQTDTLVRMIQGILLLYPNIKILGHNQIYNKACPCYFAPKFLRDYMCVPEKNIYQPDPFGYAKVYKNQPAVPF